MYQTASRIPGKQPDQSVSVGKWLTTMMAVVSMGLLLLGSAMAESIPSLPEITPAVAAANPELILRLAALSKEREALRNRTQQHNDACRSVEESSAAEAQCTRSLTALQSHLSRHIQASKQFIEMLATVGIAMAKEESERIRIIKSMNALGKRLGWSAVKQANLAEALNSLVVDGDPNATGTQIRQIWQDVLNRGHGGDIAREASQGNGPGIPGAGQQAKYQDCTVFALANAAGLPYGVVAARATKLIREGEWHDAAERANPQKLIEQNGLNGGEVVMLAEILGQAEVVRSSDFAKTLKEGRRVMVNVVPENGNANYGHEVVLTKTFQHGGETWYEMMDSNQGSQRRLYLSAKELNTMLQERGVAFRPEPGTTPKLLRHGDKY